MRRETGQSYISFTDLCSETRNWMKIEILLTLWSMILLCKVQSSIITLRPFEEGYTLTKSTAPNRSAHFQKSVITEH